MLRSLFCIVWCIFASFLLNSNSLAQSEPGPEDWVWEGEWGCDSLPFSYSYIPIQKGGRFFTSEGTVKALFVFVQFAGDTSNPSSNVWPLNQAPAYQPLDSTLAQQSTSRNFSHWLRVMSFDNMKMYGDTYFVITDSSKSWYAAHGGYGAVNKDVLKKLDSYVNFSSYDNWTIGNSYNHRDEPDDIVDWIFIVHREDLESSIHPGNGKADLGFTSLLVDGNSLTISGSLGASLEKGYQGMKTHHYAHEIGHHWLGSHTRYHDDNNPYSNLGFWGVLFSNSWVANASDRHWLKWGDYSNLEITDSINIVVTDYLTTGDAYRIPIPGTTDEAFFIENHQGLSGFDDWIYWDGDGYGLYIYHVKGNYNSTIFFDVEIAEGEWEWSNPFWDLNPWRAAGSNDSLPVFAQDYPKRGGRDGRDKINHTKGGREKIYLTDNDGDNEYDINRRVFGSEKDAFNLGYNEVFSEYSNPSTAKWNGGSTDISIEITGTTTGYNGETIFNVKVRVVDPENGRPANPLLLNIQNHSSGGNDGIKLTWNSNLEPDIDGYEVYYKTTGSPAKISGGTLVSDTTWVHWGYTISSTGTNHTYYIKAVDTQGKVSNLSNGISAITQAVSQGGSKSTAETEKENEVIEKYALYQNYPNPFNPLTQIRFDLPAPDYLELKIYNIQGQLIKTLLQGLYTAGQHRVEWDGSSDYGIKVASGIYFYSLTAGSFKQTRKMLLVE